MLTHEEAKTKGINACIDKLGRDFFNENKKEGKCCTAHGEHDGKMFCYVGVDHVITEEDFKRPMLTSKPKAEYRVSCDVDMQTGEITFIEVILPKRKKTA